MTIPPFPPRPERYDHYRDWEYNESCVKHVKAAITEHCPFLEGHMWKVDYNGVHNFYDVSVYNDAQGQGHEEHLVQARAVLGEPTTGTSTWADTDPESRMDIGPRRGDRYFLRPAVRLVPHS